MAELLSLSFSSSDRASELMKPAPKSPKSPKSPNHSMSKTEEGAFLNKLRSTPASIPSFCTNKEEAIQKFFELIKTKNDNNRLGLYIDSFLASREGKVLDKETLATITDEYAMTALEYVLRCKEKHAEFNAIALLTRGINTKPCPKTGYTPLMFGIYSGNYEFCWSLLHQKLGYLNQERADFQELNDSKYLTFQGWNALYLAIYSGDFALVKLLVESGYSAPPPTKCVPGIIHFVIHECRDMSNAEMIAKYLVENGYGINDTFCEEQMTTYQSALLHGMQQLADAIYNHKDYQHGRTCFISGLYSPITDEDFKELLKFQPKTMLRKCPDGPCGFSSAYPRQTKPQE